MSLWTYEARRVGPAVLAIPVVTAVLAAIAMAMASAGPSGSRIVAGTLETLPPLAGAVVAATVTGRDRARELQLSLPASYRTTLARRLSIGLAVVVVSGLALTGGAILSTAWSHPPELLQAQLVWLAPSAFLAALGAAVSVLTASSGLGTGAAGALWVIEVAKPAFFIGRPWQPLYLFAEGAVPGAPFHSGGTATPAWWVDRGALGLTALALAVVAAVAVGNPDRLLRSSP